MKKATREWTLSIAAERVRMDKGKLSRLLEEHGVEPRVVKSAHYYDVDKLVPIVVDKKGAQSSTDRRNDAQARKAEVETGILEKRYIPVEEVVAPIRAAISAMSKIVGSSSMTDDEKARVIERLQVCLEDYEEGEQDE
jgi:hypothetical protein